MVTFQDAHGYFPGDDDIYIDLNIQRVATSGNSSQYSWRLEEENPSLHKGKYSASQYPYKVIINGVTVASGTHDLDFRKNTSSYDEWNLSTGTTAFIPHDANGDLTFTFSAYHDGTGTALGKAQLSGTFKSDRLYYPPLKPTNITFGNSTSTSITLTGVPNADTGHQPILDYQFQITDYSDTDWNGSLLQNRVSGSLTQTFSGLQPGVQYRARFRARNSKGYSPWSDDYLKTAGVIGAPASITVTPSVAGSSAVITAGATPNLPNPSGYRIERTNPGGSTTILDVTSLPYTATGLTPGSTYSWRIAAKSGSFVSGYSPTSGAIKQPNPNTNPGDFFDGSSTSSGITYAWLGTVGKSISTASAPSVTGWSVSHTTSGGTSALTRSLGGLFGTYAALMTMKTDATAAGVLAGIDTTTGKVTVEPTALYYGSIYVLTSKTQRLQAVIRWFDSGGSFISASLGLDQVVQANTWTRLTTSGTSPSTVDAATVRVQDVSGTSWSLWLAGDRMMMDGAMLSLGEQLDYFDGSFTDTVDYDYVWDGTANSSSSTRNVVVSVPIDLLADPDVTPVPTAPRPPTVPDVSLTSTDMWRRYWVSIPDDYISQWLTVLPTFTLTTGSEASHQARIRIFENPDDLDPTTIDVHTWVSEQIISFIPANTVLTLDSVSQRAYASLNGGEELAADKLLYGTNGEPATWPALSCGQGYLVAVDVPIDSPEGNLSVEVALTRRW